MPDGDSPAAVAEAPTATTEAPVETPAPSAPAAHAEETSTPAAPQAPAEPDIESLLSRDDFLERLRKHPKIQAEVEHRAKSVRQTDVERIVEERMRTRDAQVQAQAQAAIRRAQEEQSDAEIERLIADDPSSPLAMRLAQEVSNRKAARQAETQRQQILQQEWPKFQQEAEIVANRRMIDLLQKTIGKLDLSDDERKELDPLNPKFTDGESYVQAVLQAVGSREAKKLAKDLAKQEAEAIVQERLAERRTSEKAPVTLPPGEGAASDADFLKEFGSPNSNNNDFKRAREVLKGIGISL